MTQEHPITPSSELVEKWYEAIDNSSTSWKQELTTQAARWGADMELEACCADIHTVHGQHRADWLRSMRRPKPPSLKEQALKALDDISIASFEQDAANTIRYALEQLDD